MSSAKPKFSDCCRLRKVRRHNDRLLGELTPIFTEREITRKQYLRSLENRTPEQIAEEEALYLELKRLEQTERQFTKDRKDLLGTLLGIESGSSDIPLGDETSLQNLSLMPEIRKNRRRTGGGMDIDSPSTPSSSIMQQRRVSTVKNAAYGTLAPPPTPGLTSLFTLSSDALHCITRTDVPQTTATKSSHQAVALRTYKIPTPKQALATKVSQTLGEHGINSSRLVMPTRENLLHLESLIEATTLLLETRKNVDKVEQDIRVMKGKVVMMKGEQPGGGEGGEVPMDVDQEAVADDDDAEPNPGRGARKKNVGVCFRSDGLGDSDTG